MSVPKLCSLSPEIKQNTMTAQRNFLFLNLTIHCPLHCELLYRNIIDIIEFTIPRSNNSGLHRTNESIYRNLVFVDPF